MSMRRNAIKTPTPHFLRLQAPSKYLCIGPKSAGGDRSLPSPCAQSCSDVGHKVSYCQRQRKSGYLGLIALSWPLTLLRACRPLPLEGLGQDVQEPANKATAQSQLLLLSQREVRSPATQDIRLRPWAAPHSPCVPASPQQELGAVRNSVSLRLVLGTSVVSQLPAPMPWLKCISLTTWLHIRIMGSRNQNSRLLPSTLPQ